MSPNNRQNWTYVKQLDFEKFNVEIVFLRPPWTKALRMRYLSGKTLLARSRVHSVFPLWDCLWFVALATIPQAKNVFWAIRSRSVTAWLPQANVHHWKGTDGDIK